MPEPFKEMFNAALVERLALAIASVEPGFDRPAFTQAVLDKAWNSRELKDRMHHIAVCLGQFVPGSYKRQVEILKTVAHGFKGFPAIVFPDFTAEFGLDDFEVSVEALRFFTPLASSEFGVRPFIVRYGSRMMETLETWASDPDEHVRRLASEGCRSRLPWGMALADFKRDPSPVLRVLELLKQDPSEYVRRSVANNLNDISKDHPEITLTICNRWKGQHPDTDALIVHALRGLLKSGNQAALALCGVQMDAPLLLTEAKASPESLAIGETMKLTATIRNAGETEQNVRFEYAITFQNRSGKGGRKVFQWKKAVVAPGETITIVKRHAFRDVSIRKHYPGDHTIALILNGKTQFTTTVHLIAQSYRV
jgi:3-methyladenine DNA glycosylase AlkC